MVLSTGNVIIVTLGHMKKLKNNAFVGNTGHFDNAIDSAGPEGLEGVKVENFKPQVDRFVFPDGHSVIVLLQADCSTWLIVIAFFLIMLTVMTKMWTTADEKYGWRSKYK